MIEKTISLYTCEICNTDYDTPEECQKCEQFHKTGLKLGEMKYLPKKAEMSCYPEEIFLEDEDGKKIKYWRRRM
jgi:hypothetical protein